MTDMDMGESGPLITVVIGDRRLPARMVARRIRADLRQPRGILPSRFQRSSRLTVGIAAALLIPALGMGRVRTPMVIQSR